jgi:hypothetical protein
MPFLNRTSKKFKVLDGVGIGRRPYEKKPTGTPMGFLFERIRF